MDVASLVCPVPNDDLLPTQVTLTSRSCGYSHNYMKVELQDSSETEHLNGKRAVCVRPTMLSEPELKTLIARYIEYWRYMGIDQVFLYFSAITDPVKLLLKVYETDTQRILTSVDWTSIDKMTEHPVSAEAATNHCIMNNMMSYDYIIVASFDHIPVFLTNQTSHLKQMIQDPTFLKEIKIKSGFRISGPSDNYSTFIVKPRDILATAANHFIPLSAKPSFQLLHPFDITMVSMGTLWFHDNRLRMAYLKKEIDAAAIQKLSLQKYLQL